MGQTSKPLTLVIHKSIYDAHKIVIDVFAEQGYNITVVVGDEPDIYLAPYALRMTADMLAQLPTALALAIKGARALRYAPHGVIPMKGKSKGAKSTKAHKGGHVKIKVKTDVTSISGSGGGESTTVFENTGVRRTAVSPVSNTTDNEGIIETII